MRQTVRIQHVVSLLVVAAFVLVSAVTAAGAEFEEFIYDPGVLPPTDSELKVSVGDEAPDFTLPSISGIDVTLSDYRKKSNVVLSFVPAAWTPVCSQQWPEYNNHKDMFDENDAILLGISVDNVPTLYSWTKNMCGVDGALWFPVFSDFYPHGAVAKKYGVLRSNGISERALFVIDQKRIIRFIDIHDINKKPSLVELQKALEDLKK